MDRCAVFVDAGYLASGAGAMPEARRMSSVSWDYPGLLRLLSDVARNPVRVRGGHAELPAGAGLGVDIDEAALQRLTFAA